MQRTFSHDIADQDQFVVTLELVPGSRHTGRKLETVIEIAEDAYKDGRISAVSITDNPGGSPALGPSALAYKILEKGLDVIVHMACRDMNRGGLESRALQMAMVGMRNILAVNGDYIGKAFGGQGKPVFDLDSVGLVLMLSMLREREREIDSEGFFTGCAVSPFKQTEAECFAQYAKMVRKIAAGADFLITQLGYDARKFDELIRIQKQTECSVPTLASLYVLTPGVARMMNEGKIPGCVVSDRLLQLVVAEWKDKAEGHRAAIERAAKLAVVLKGLGYRGIHIGGIHSTFKTAAQILDKMEEIEDRWQEFLPEFDYSQENGYYIYSQEVLGTSKFGRAPKDLNPISVFDKSRFHFFDKLHSVFFNADAFAAPWLRSVSNWLDKYRMGRGLVHLLEDPFKILLLSCQRCGDCGIQHLAFQCPESGCPKHTRNGACGGSLNGRCEVRPEQKCIWAKAYQRWESVGQTDHMFSECVPPRMWELNHTSSWLNFHLGRDHQAASTEVIQLCRSVTVKLVDREPAILANKRSGKK
jgi:methylenetetrahydrofolate reductase (NADPH)